MKNLLGLLVVGLIMGLTASLMNCTPSESYAMVFRPQFDSTFLYDSNRMEMGIWSHVIGNDSVAVTWGSWIDSVGGRFAEQGRYETTYALLPESQVKIPEGNWQFKIFPLDTPARSANLIYYSYTVAKVDHSRVIQFSAATDYYLVLLDTTGTWDYNTGSVSQGYQYKYYLGIEKEENDYYPAYSMDYYCGTRGVDSTLLQFYIPLVSAGTIYGVKCFQNFDVGFKIFLDGVMDQVEWTFHEI